MEIDEQNRELKGKFSHFFKKKLYRKYGPEAMSNSPKNKPGRSPKLLNKNASTTFTGNQSLRKQMSGGLILHNLRLKPLDMSGRSDERRVDKIQKTQAKDPESKIKRLKILSKLKWPHQHHSYIEGNQEALEFATPDTVKKQLGGDIAKRKIAQGKLLNSNKLGPPSTSNLYQNLSRNNRLGDTTNKDLVSKKEYASIRSIKKSNSGKISSIGKQGCFVSEAKISKQISDALQKKRNAIGIEVNNLDKKSPPHNSKPMSTLLKDRIYSMKNQKSGFQGPHPSSLYYKMTSNKSSFLKLNADSKSSSKSPNKNFKSLLNSTSMTPQKSPERRSPMRMRFGSYLKHKSPRIGERETYESSKEKEGDDKYNFMTTPDCYNLLKVIGKGSFGKVHLGLQVLTNIKVAIKTIDKNTLANNEKAREKVNSEIKVFKLARGNPSVVRLLEVFEDERFYYFVMEYEKGGDLLNYMREKGVMPEDKAKIVMNNTIEGLEHLHKKMILHRDIKLDNILLGSEFNAKIADFGISCTIVEGEILYKQCGTPAYLAPEIIKNEGYTGFATDIWSLGVLLHTLLLGKVPFKADTLEVLYSRILSSQVEIPSSPRISEECKDLILRMLDKNPKDRISVDEIKKHPWFDDLAEKEKHDIAKERDSSKQNREIALATLEELGFSRRYVKESVQQGKLNHASACFYSLATKTQTK